MYDWGVLSINLQVLVEEIQTISIKFTVVCLPKFHREKPN